MKRILPIITLASLSACNDGKTAALNWMTAPSDPQVEAFLFDQCLSKSRGPVRTYYNDLDEMVAECSRVAAMNSTFCPKKLKCAPNLLPRADVRMILPKQELESKK